MVQTCLVTGGAGFIGSAISGKLFSMFKRVVVIDSLHPQIHPQSVRPPDLDSRVELFVADVTRADTWDRVLPNVHPDVIIHLAAETGTGQSLTEGSRHAEVNVVGTTRMLDALVRHESMPKRIVLTSSRAVYGEGAWKDLKTGEVSYPGQRTKDQLEHKEWDFKGLKCLPFDAEITEPRPTSVYGVTKLAQEYILKAWANSFGVPTAILRLQNVYGPGQAVSNPYTGIVTLFAQLARANLSIPVYEDGLIFRDFVYIEDVAHVVCRACDSAHSSLLCDVGLGKSISIYDLAHIIAGIYGAPAPQINGAYRNGDVRHASCRVERARSALDWTANWSVEHGVRELCRWIDSRA